MEERRGPRDQEDLKAVWPQPLVEDLNDAGRPVLDDSDGVEDWVIKHEKVYVYVFTWNQGANAPPSDPKTAEAMFPRNK